MLEENVNNYQECELNIFELGKHLSGSDNRKPMEKNLIIIGERASGKSTLFNNILLNSTQKETYTPTCGINYSYMRYQPSASKKLILNVYEIGGGLANLDLIKTILNQKNILSTNFILNLDFSKPQKLIFILKDYLKKLQTILKEICENEKLSEIIENKRLKYRDINSNDFKRVNIFPANLILICNKYDVLEKIDYEKIKWTCRTLRFYCHAYSLSLVFFKWGDQKLCKLLNSLITSIAFNVNNENALQYSQKNDSLPLYILNGSDTFDEIGDPKVTIQGVKDLYTLWDESYNSMFTNEQNDLINEDYSKIENSLKEKYIEPRIDEELLNFE